MVRGKGTKVREILSSSEKDNLLDQKRELQDTLRETQEYGIGTSAQQIDKARIEKEISKIDKAIEDRTAPKVRGKEKDDLNREAQEIEEILREGMPTKEEMRFPARNPGAVRKHMNWNKRNSDMVERYRYIQKVINPDDPHSVENLRREK